MNIKPGDLFVWVDRDDNSSVINDELYSYSMEKWVPCSGLCLCVGMNNGVIHWFSNKGLFRTRVDKAPRPRLPRTKRGMVVIPRKVEL